MLTTSQTPTTPIIHSALSGYELLGRAWDEPTCRVFHGRHAASDGPILIKISRSNPSAPNDASGLARDYQISSSAGIPGVVHPLDFAVLDGRAWLVLEDDGARPLSDLLDAQPLDIATVLKIGVSLAGLLEALHAGGIVHNNITPYSVWGDLRTGAARITDFALADQMPEISPSHRRAARLRGDLGYISPEQTGRISHPVDSRSDLYATGVLLFHTLVGTPPFADAGSLEIIHAHLARPPPVPHARDQRIPAPLSDIVVKLLAKSPDERYQTARGLRRDLEECLAQWQISGTIAPIAIAASDVNAIFRLPQKLYGREAEIAVLSAAFDRAAVGAAEIVLVSGPPGIGKSQLVRALEPTFATRGAFVSAKFDQFGRNEPYAFVQQAFRQLVQQILALSDDVVVLWKDRLTAALGVNGRVIVELVPELELIMGKQSPLEFIPPGEARNRFRRAFGAFIRVCARNDHPLCIFLDDMQWADGASLEVIEALLADRDMRYLLLVGAYRQNEGLPDTFSAALRRLPAATPPTEIQLGALNLEEIAALLNDALPSASETMPLAELIWQKTEGNPFFVAQFLTLVHLERLIVFEHDSGKWVWDLTAISTRGFTDNVISLMTRKLARLPSLAQQGLAMASYMGNIFDVRKIALVTGHDEGELLDAMRVVQREGLIAFAEDGAGSPADDAQEATPAYRFSHDRVQQAAHALIPQDARKATRLRIGVALLENLPPARLGMVPFEILDNLNEGAELVESPIFREQIARLNLQAGRRARESAAFAAAIDYFRAGMSLLRSDCWTAQYELARDLHLERFECAYVTGRIEEANTLFDAAITLLATRIEKAQAYYTKILLSTGVEHSDRAVALGIVALGLFGMRLPAVPTKAHLFIDLLRVEILLLARRLRGRRDKDLLYLPPMTDPTRKATIDLLMSICPAAYFRNPDLMALAALRIMSISLRYGNSGASSFGYVLYGLVCVAILGRYQTGHEFGVMAIELAAREASMAHRAKILMIFGGFINFWREPIDTSIETCRLALQLALDAGDVQYADYSILQIIFLGLARGHNLEDLRAECKRHGRFVTATKDVFATVNIALRLQFVLALQDTHRPTSTLDRAGYDEAAAVAEFLDFGNLTTFSYYSVLKTQLCYLCGELDHAFVHAEASARHMQTALGQIVVAEHHFYRGLTVAALLRRKHRPAGATLAALKDAVARMRTWARNCPFNFRQQLLLLEAEMAGLRGHYQRADALYDEAIEAANSSGYIHVAALANELAGESYFARGRLQVARTYLEAALTAYTNWGAAAKARLLREHHADFLAPFALAHIPAAKGIAAMDGTGGKALSDFDTMLRASAEVSMEVEADRAIPRLMRLVLEGAGAQRAVFATVDEGALRVRATGNAEGEHVHIVRASDGASAAAFSESIVRYVLRTCSPIAIENASADSRFGQCPHIRATQPRSVLCVPLLRAGRAGGVIYAENNLLYGNFAADRVQPIIMLAQQVVSVLESAKLSQELSDSAASLQHARQDIELLESIKAQLAKFVPNIVHELVAANPHSSDLATRSEDVSVMFIDMVGYTALSERLPGEELKAIIETYFSSFLDDIHSAGGDICEIAGDGVMIIFRDPDREEHARQAVRAALAVREKTAEVNAALAGKWPAVLINAGIHSGEALLGAHKIEGLGGTRWSFAVTGFTANLAARIGDFASKDAIFVSGATASRLAEQFELRELGPQRFKGVTALVDIFAVVGSRGQAAPSNMAPRSRHRRRPRGMASGETDPT